MKVNKLALYGACFCIAGLSLYIVGVLVAIPRRLFFESQSLLQLNELMVWYSGAPLVFGILLILLDLLILYSSKRGNDYIFEDTLNNPSVTVVLTAYNDEESIAIAVADFLSHWRVKRVIVVSNNSKDGTFNAAVAAGAITFNESRPGYGACVYRALTEGIKYHDTDLTVLCEGDMTFRAYDIDKLISYIPHADIVNGTRTVEQLRAKDTQLSAFMFYGNLFVGKLLETKHIGHATFTDVGTTYKICRNSALIKLLPKLNPEINLEFNPYFLDMALENNLRVIECPITFHKRIGFSKGGNASNFIALKLGFRMIKGIIFGWN